MATLNRMCAQSSDLFGSLSFFFLPSSSLSTCQSVYLIYGQKFLFGLVVSRTHTPGENRISAIPSMEKKNKLSLPIVGWRAIVSDDL